MKDAAPDPHLQAGPARRFRHRPAYDANVLYRLAYSINASYGLVIAWGYIALFAIALSLLFVFPQVTLLLFFLSLGSLAVTIALGWGIDELTRHMARRALRRGFCPRCRQHPAPPHAQQEEWSCPACGALFRTTGDEINLADRARYIEIEMDEHALRHVHHPSP